MQKFIKGRGTKASVYRVFWKADAVGAGASGTVSDWYITKSDDEYLCYDEETMDPARISSKKRDQDEEAGNENKEQHGPAPQKTNVGFIHPMKSSKICPQRGQPTLN